MTASASISALIVLVTLVLSASAPDPLLVLATGGVLVAAIGLLWRDGTPPILLLPFGLQWAQVAIKPIQTGLSGLSLDTLSDFHAALTPAAWMSLAALTALAVGMAIGAGRFKGGARVFLDQVRAAPEKMIIVPCILAIIAGHVVEALSWRAGGAGQQVLALANLGLAGLFVLTAWCAASRRRLEVLTVVLAIELGLGMTGFFANFRPPLLIFVIALVSAQPKLQPGLIFGGATAGALIVGLAIFWSAIKPDYRAFLNEGTGAQVATQPMSARIEYLQNAAATFDEDDFNQGLTALTSRLSYIDYLAMTMQHVPSVVPFENGQRVKDTFTHIVTPRVFFPNKPPLPNDTVVTAKYTGMQFNNVANTSISIGWLGDLYIDFGVYGAIFGAIALGVLIGLIQRFMVGFKGTPAWLNFGLAAAAMVPFIGFETQLVKVVGGGVTAAIVAFAVQRAIALILPKRAGRSRESFAR